MVYIRVEIKNESMYPIPEYKHIGDSGMDLRANIKEPIILKPLQRVLVPSGIYLGIPEGYEIQIRPRSGLSLKTGLTAILGTVDSSYTGELGSIMVNLSNTEITIEPGDRISQIVLARVGKMDLVEVKEIKKDTTRSDGGFGHTGVK